MTAIDASALPASSRLSALPGLVLFYLGLLLVVALVALGVWAYGVVLLSMVALSLVPVMFIVLVVISRG